MINKDNLTTALYEICLEFVTDHDTDIMVTSLDLIEMTLRRMGIDPSDSNIMIARDILRS